MARITVFSKRLRDVRIDKDLSQKQVAELIPMNQSNYSKIERGLQEPSMYQLKRIVEILGVSADNLLGIDKTTLDEEKLASFQKELDNLYNKYFKKYDQTQYYLSLSFLLLVNIYLIVLIVIYIHLSYNYTKGWYKV